MKVTNLVTVCWSEFGNDLILEIWWWDGAVLVCDGKFTPDDNGTDTTKLTDVDGWCDWSAQNKFHYSKKTDHFDTSNQFRNHCISNTFTLFDDIWCWIACYVLCWICISTFLLSGTHKKKTTQKHISIDTSKDILKNARCTKYIEFEVYLLRVRNNVVRFFIS